MRMSERGIVRVRVNSEISREGARWREGGGERGDQVATYERNQLIQNVNS